MSPAFQVRPAKTSDLPGIVQRWRDLMEAHVARDPAFFELAPHAEGSYQAFVRGHLQAGEPVMVAVDAQGVAGYVVSVEVQRSPIFTDRGVGFILDLAVRPDLRRAGVGRALVKAVAQAYAARGVKRIQVDYLIANEGALTFWRALGFEPRFEHAYSPTTALLAL